LSGKTSAIIRNAGDKVYGLPYQPGCILTGCTRENLGNIFGPGKALKIDLVLPNLDKNYSEFFISTPSHGSS